MPSRVPTEIRHRLEPVRLLVLDVDGVLTDGSLTYTSRGEERKTFSVRDGLGIRLLLEAGVQVAVISGRASEAVEARCTELGIRSELIILGSKDKVADLQRIEDLLDIVDLEVAAMGDDLPDLPLLERAVFTACPADAAPEVMAVCDLVCGAPGGRGAVREFAELILKVQGKWVDVTGRWVSQGTPRP
jgi:3-deoxy-D-manno-octulosonate 8-phosphate phosphatase (KDO 8-P phosphatase)